MAHLQCRCSYRHDEEDEEEEREEEEEDEEEEKEEKEEEESIQHRAVCSCMFPISPVNCPASAKSASTRVTASTPPSSRSHFTAAATAAASTRPHLGSSRCCSPRHRERSNSRNEGRKHG